MQTLQSHVSVLRGLTPKQVELLKREIGVDTLGDLIGYYPYRYEDRTQFLARSTRVKQQAAGDSHSPEYTYGWRRA